MDTFGRIVVGEYSTVNNFFQTYNNALVQRGSWYIYETRKRNMQEFKCCYNFAASH